MNIDMNQLIVSGIGIIGVIIGVVLGQICTYFSDRRKRKEEFFMVNYQLRQKSYSEIYVALVEYEQYFKKFLNPGNEFIESEKWTDFAPLIKRGTFVSLFNKHEIWLDKEVKADIEEIIDTTKCGCHLAMHIASNDDIFDEQSVKNLCQEQVDKISMIKQKIQQKCSMNYIDKYIFRFIK